MIAPDLERLGARFVGDWAGAEVLAPTPWDPTGGDAHGTWQVRVGAGGACLTVAYVERRAGAIVYQGHGVHAWSAADRRLVAYWFDSVGTVPAAGNPATFDGERYQYTDVRPHGTNRYTYAWDGDELRFTIERTTDGVAWSRFHDGRYQRVAP